MFQSTPGVGAAAGVGGAGGAGGPNVREVTYRVKVVADVAQYNATVAAMSQGPLQNAQARHLGRTPAAGPGGGWAPPYYQAMPMYYHPPGGPPPVGSGAAAGGGGGADNGALANLAFLWARVGTAVTFVIGALEKFQRVLDAVSASGRDTVNAQAKMEAWFNAVPVVGQPIGQAMSFGAGLQERWGVNGGFGYGARAGANGRTFSTQQGLRDRLGVPEWLAAPMGEFMAGEYEYNAARDRTFLAPFDMARDAAAARARQRADELDGARKAASEEAGYRVASARDEARLLFARGGSRVVTGGTGRVRYDSDDGYDATIRGAERSRVRALGGVAAAEQSAFLARMGVQDAAAEVNRAPFAAAQRRADELAQRAKTDPTVQASLTEALAVAEREAAKLAEQLGRHQAALNKEKEKTVQLAQAEYELGQKGLAVQQARLQVAEDRMRKNDAGATEFAFMNGFRRQGLIDSARQLQENGFESLSPRQRELLQGSGITGDFVRKAGRDFANADNATREQLDELFKLTGQQTRREIMDEKKKLQAEIEVQMVVNEEALAKALRAAFQKIDPELRKLLEESFKLETAKIRRQESAARAQNK